ncbi:hypothetical protein [Micropruina sonneratiae]|uniref:hypothetical protein n=1 Tax=Micropruina sonneratiae TaxID=2986940 RepID=UPI002227CAE3|nr:hypothetical protein [Micropruina sp. KQZ13P-5]MCW3158599.1 hypothetical protein [Micropruina sp. KQZ13P-5]
MPYTESPTRDGVNRRDIIIPNYASDGFWAHMLLFYSAHYIVVDAKNYVGAVKKREVLQLGNYLSQHGAGLFGMIACRTALDAGAEITRRELWAFHRKMIVVLNDDDLIQMLVAHAGGSDPGDVIRQKIEDFRLGF